MDRLATPKGLVTAPAGVAVVMTHCRQSLQQARERLHRLEAPESILRGHHQETLELRQPGEGRLQLCSCHQHDDR